MSKAKILNELKNGEKHEFYKKCYSNDYAFDIVVDGKKLEVHPSGSDYWKGAEVVNCKTFDTPVEIMPNELSAILG